MENISTAFNTYATPANFDTMLGQFTPLLITAVLMGLAYGIISRMLAKATSPARKL